MFTFWVRNEHTWVKLPNRVRDWLLACTRIARSSSGTATSFPVDDMEIEGRPISLLTVLVGRAGRATNKVQYWKIKFLDGGSGCVKKVRGEEKPTSVGIWEAGN
jgi:hypothetical protein